MDNTRENLNKPFAGESRASERYLAFWQRTEEGFLKDAKFFRVISEVAAICENKIEGEAPEKCQICVGIEGQTLKRSKS